MIKRKPSVSHEQSLIRELRADPEFCAEYLKAAIEDTTEPKVLLLALRHIAEARGGIAKVAKAAGIERESLYPRAVRSWKSSALHACRSRQSCWFEAHP